MAGFRSGVLRRRLLLLGLFGVLAFVGVFGSVSGSSATTTAGHIYWAKYVNASPPHYRIGRARLDGTGADDLFKFSYGDSEGVSVDAKYVYWANDGRGTIGRAKLDGTGANDSFMELTRLPRGVTVDAGHIYWTTYYQPCAIGRANLDGTNADQNFITGVGCGLQLAVDASHLYWADGDIYRANLDGTGAQTFIGTGGRARGVAVDANYIYWTTANTANAEGGIGRANLDGTNVDGSFITGLGAVTLQGVSYPDGIAVDADHIYWGTWNSPNLTIGRASLDGTNVDNTFITGAGMAGAVAVLPLADGYSVAYDGNDATGGLAPSDESSPYAAGTIVTVLGAGTLTRTGYAFNGWNTQADGGGTAYSPGDTFSMPASAVTLYAQWTINSYAVAYNGNGATGGLAPTDGSNPHVYGTTVAVLGRGSLVRTGYTFDGWNTQANGGGTAYKRGGTFPMPASAVTLYAQWAKYLRAGTTTCNGTYAGTGSSVVVPALATCTFIPGTRVKGSVTVKPRGTLHIDGVTIGGTLTVSGTATVCGSKIHRAVVPSGGLVTLGACVGQTVIP